ncbi:MAG: glycosyltransferase [Candidatus Omnitrophica bacterium]|nr:glycosyltransferase [Candidatus Omnitrophota bacterium]
MDTLSSVAIVILNWNGFDDTVECLESLRDTDYGNYQIVLVDNASDNDEGARLGSMFPEVHLIQNRKNKGFAGGNNDGMNWALEKGFDYVVNLNNDTIAEKGWLKHLMRGMQTSGADFASPRIMNYPEEATIFSDGDFILPDGSGVALNRYSEYDGDTHIKLIFSACGAASVYSRKCLEEVKVEREQYFDELYFAFYEDIDMGIRLNARGFKGVCVPKAVIYHKHSRTAGRHSGLKLFHSEKNRMLNELLNYPAILVVLGELFFLVKLLVKTVALVVRSSAPGRSREGGYVENLGFTRTITEFVRARMWILGHFGRIMEKRRKRREKGFIVYSILKKFYWNIFRIA